MSVRVDLEELLDALQWTSAGQSSGVDAAAFVVRVDGRILCVGEGIDEEPPEDLEDGTAYLAVPDMHELDLGRQLVFDFVEEQAPDLRRRVEGLFRQRGAYARFKDLLHGEGRLQAWHAYEKAATESALVAWCEENGLVASRG